jgi:hypothetical protein
MRSSLRALVVATVVAFVPDIVVPGTRGIQVVTRLELGPLADKVQLAYEVQKGDTLAAIARDRLGDEKRLPELVAANPGIDPEKLPIGKLLWLPAKDPAVKDAPHLLVSMAPNRDLGYPVQHGKPLPDSRYTGHTLLLVPADLLAEATGKDRKVREQAMAQPRIQRLEASGCSSSVQDRSPVHRAEVTVQVFTDKDGKLAVRTAIVWCGADGKPLPVDEHGNPKAPAPKEGALLLVLAMVGGGFLVWRGRGKAPQLALA